MFRLLLQLFCIFSLMSFNQAEDEYSALFEENQAYNIYRLYRQFHSLVNFRDQNPFLSNHFQFNRSIGNLTFDFALQNSSKCLRDISYMFESLRNFSNQWALRMLDSFAKPESGIFQGNLLWVGEYNECIKVHAPPKLLDSTTGDFNGQYCSLSLSAMESMMSFGICLPDSCSPKDLQAEVMHLLLKAGRFPVLDQASSLKLPLTVVCKPRERYLNAGATSILVILSIFLLFALLGSSITVVKYFKKVWKEQKQSSLIFNFSNQGNTTLDQDSHLKNNKVSEEESTENKFSRGLLDRCEPFLTSFCVFTNGAKLLNTDSSEGQLLCIHGIRFLSMSWVVLGHSYSYATFYQSIRNRLELLDIVKDDFFFQAITQAFFSVDSFFVLSGFLLTYLAMKEFSKTKGSINWVYFYIHRYIRLTPIYMIVLGFSSSLYFYIGSGPLWPTGDYDPNCKERWWWNLLYINNFDKTVQCMTWSWYLANDMQFFIISPLFLITLWRWPKVGYSLLGLSLLATALCNFIITYQYDLSVGIVSFIDVKNLDLVTAMQKYSDYFLKLYVKPYTRIGPYVIGIILGYLIFRHKATNRPKLGLVYLCAGWIVASAITLTTMYGLYHSHLSLVANSFYNAFSHIIFALGLSWVIYVCLTNQSAIVNNILSYKLFIPLSRLTYAAYLIHPLIITTYFSSLKIPFDFSHPSMVMVFLGFMVVTYGLALPVSLILESPIVALEKIIRSKFTKPQQTESNS